MTTDASAGSFVQVFIVHDGGCYHVEAHHWDAIDAALHQWIERRVDKVLALTCTNGCDLLLPASRIGEVCMSTPVTRERGREQDAAMKAEGGFAD